MDDKEEDVFHLPVGDPIKGETIPVHIISDEEMQNVDYPVLCIRKEDMTPEISERFPDNLEGPCSWGCGHIVVWRPYLPEKAPKVCLQCLTERLQQEDAGGPN